MNLTYEAAKALGAALAAAAPGLNVQVLQAEHDHPAAYPALSIVPRGRKFRPQQDDIKDSSAATTYLASSGFYEAIFELRIHAATPYERELWEEKVQAAFFASEFTSGTLVVSVANVVAGGVTSTFTANIPVRWRDGEWREELAFSARRYTFVEVDVAVPVLATRAAPTIQTLNLDLAQDSPDMRPVDTGADAVQDMATQQVTINQDGSIS